VENLDKPFMQTCAGGEGPGELC